MRRNCFNLGDVTQILLRLFIEIGALCLDCIAINFTEVDTPSAQRVKREPKATDTRKQVDVGKCSVRLGIHDETQLISANNHRLH